MTPAPVFDRSSPCAGAGPAVQPVRVADDAQLVRAAGAAVADGRRHRHAVEPAGHRHRAAQRECPLPPSPWLSFLLPPRPRLANASFHVVFPGRPLARILEQQANTSQLLALLLSRGHVLIGRGHATRLFCPAGWYGREGRRARRQRGARGRYPRADACARSRRRRRTRAGLRGQSTRAAEATRRAVAALA